MGLVRAFLRKGARGQTPDGRTLWHLEGRVYGAAAFLLDRQGAQMAIPVFEEQPSAQDSLLFDLFHSPLARALRPLQVVPAMARQFGPADSDQQAWRDEETRSGGAQRRRRRERRKIGYGLYKCRLAALRTAGRVRSVRL